MKKIKLNNKLKLNKETIANLNVIKGGGEDGTLNEYSIWGCNTNKHTRGGGCCPPSIETGTEYSCQVDCPMANL